MTGVAAARDDFSEVARGFPEDGYAGPLRLLDRRSCGRVLRSLRGAERRATPEWRKGWAAVAAEYYALATSEQLLEVVEQLLGPEVILWGASLVHRRPGAVHPWHTDVETSSPDAAAVSVWIGLANTDSRSSLTVVRGSHRFGVPFQEERRRRGRERADVAEEDVEAWARAIDGHGELVRLDAHDGEAVFFDGRLWHGSTSLRRRGTRSALLLQYATPSTPIRMPDPGRWEEPSDPAGAPRAPCLVVLGRDTSGVNRVVAPPVPDGRGARALGSRVCRLELPLERDRETGWKPHGLLRGSTTDVADLRCHASVLEPGHSPHPPHRHEHEEILLVLDGTADLLVADPDDPERLQRHTTLPGTFAFYPAGCAHTLESPSDAPVTYLMLKWRNEARSARAPLGPRSVTLPELEPASARGRAITDLLDGETAYLRHLHAHATVLEAGAGYEPHADSYDVLLVVLRGTVETLGERLGPYDVVLYAAGEPHGMRNVGREPAVYLVFELHGRRSTSRRIDDRGLRERAALLVREPGRLKHGLGALARRLPSGR